MLSVAPPVAFPKRFMKLWPVGKQKRVKVTRLEIVHRRNHMLSSIKCIYEDKNKYSGDQLPLSILGTWH